MFLQRKQQGSASLRNAATFKATLVLDIVKLLPDDKRTGDGNYCAEKNYLHLADQSPELFIVSHTSDYHFSEMCGACKRLIVPDHVACKQLTPSPPCE